MLIKEINASSICLYKIFFVEDNTEIVQDKNFVNDLIICIGTMGVASTLQYQINVGYLINEGM